MYTTRFGIKLMLYFVNLVMILPVSASMKKIELKNVGDDHLEIVLFSSICDRIQELTLQNFQKNIPGIFDSIITVLNAIKADPEISRNVDANLKYQNLFENINILAQLMSDTKKFLETSDPLIINNLIKRLNKGFEALPTVHDCIVHVYNEIIKKHAQKKKKQIETLL